MATAPAPFPLAVRKEKLVEAITAKISALAAHGKLDLPAHYSVHNALKSAWLRLQSVKTKDDKPVLTACTEASIGHALLSMAVQALNPDKQQCYFIAYGDQLACQRSYFGSMAMAQRYNPELVGDFTSAVVYKGDGLKYQIERGRHVILEHVQALANVDDRQIVAAYCQIWRPDGTLLDTELMTIAQIHSAWRKSKANPFHDRAHDHGNDLKPESTHYQFPGEMAQRTVINRACKRWINRSDDSALVRAAIHASDEESITQPSANTGEEVTLNGAPQLPGPSGAESSDERASAGPGF